MPLAILFRLLKKEFVFDLKILRSPKSEPSIEQLVLGVGQVRLEPGDFHEKELKVCIRGVHHLTNSLIRFIIIIIVIAVCRVMLRDNKVGA